MTSPLSRSCRSRPRDRSGRDARDNHRSGGHLRPRESLVCLPVHVQRHDLRVDLGRRTEDGDLASVPIDSMDIQAHYDGERERVLSFWKLALMTKAPRGVPMPPAGTRSRAFATNGQSPSHPNHGETRPVPNAQTFPGRRRPKLWPARSTPRTRAPVAPGSAPAPPRPASLAASGSPPQSCDRGAPAGAHHPSLPALAPHTAPANRSPLGGNPPSVNRRPVAPLERARNRGSTRNATLGRRPGSGSQWVDGCALM
jgi:hypothetical protein